MSSDDVAAVVSRMTGVPVTKVIRAEAKYLINLEKNLSRYVIGQDEAVSAVARAVRRNRSGVGSEERPIGSFIFLGPTGVGKTELARVLAREFFGSSDNLVKIDMSEFGEHHNVSRLVGAPAGYVGYDDGGQLRMGKSASDHALEKAKEILDELRRRAGERSRPEIERNYIDRLLKEF